MNCTVYKSLREFDYYLYVPSDADLSALPEGLLALLGSLDKVIDLELHAERKLARADVVEVMKQIEEAGYYLQMPPRSRPGPLES